MYSFATTLPEGTRGDYDRLIEELKSRFGRKDRLATARRKLGELKQGKELVEEYVERIWK